MDCSYHSDKPSQTKAYNITVTIVVVASLVLVLIILILVLIFIFYHKQNKKTTLLQEMEDDSEDGNHEKSTHRSHF